MKILITGVAGFIGFHLAKNLLQKGIDITGLDNINDYYEVDLKYDRLEQLGVNKEKITDKDGVLSNWGDSGFRFFKVDISDKDTIVKIFDEGKFDVVINLAAQAGVRYSIENPDAYMQSNVMGFFNILEACRKFPIKHLIHASSSSVYGDNSKIPFSEDDKTDSPVSLYAATKKSNELMAHAYSRLYNIPITCLRFFTVYGPWGRPDMAPMIFAKAISHGEFINVFNGGDMERDFTYIGDIVGGISGLVSKEPGVCENFFRVLNIGNGSPVNLMDFIRILEVNFGKDAAKKFVDMQPGDVKRTWADTSKLQNLIGDTARCEIDEGVRNFAEWYKVYHGSTVINEK